MKIKEFYYLCVTDKSGNKFGVEFTSEEIKTLKYMGKFLNKSIKKYAVLCDKLNSITTN